MSNEEHSPEEQAPLADGLNAAGDERAEEPTAESLFGPEEAVDEEAAPTAESLFGPEATGTEEEPSAAEVLLAVAPAEEEPAPKARPGAKAKARSTEKVDEEAAEEVEEAPRLVLREPPDDGMERRWYALHAHSGQESNVRNMLLLSAEQQGLSDLMTNVFVPMEEVSEHGRGEGKTHTRKFFPGYVLLQLPKHPEKFPELWQLIKETPGVTGFIGSRNLPSPLEDAEVEAIVEVIRGERERPKPKVAFNVGERVKIIDGPFANFLGKIDDINAERGTMKVLVEIFERMTTIEVEFWQVEQV